MTQQLAIDPRKTAVLVMDFQNDIVGTAAGDPGGVVEKAASVLQGARQKGIPVIYVMHRGGRFEEASKGTEIHAGVAPPAGEKIFTKTKAGSFSTTGLDVTLREKGIDTLVMMGVATSGCVLSTVRWAADVDYKIIVVSDACSDRDPEVHRVLTEKIYPRQGTVLTAQEFLNAAGVT